MKNRIFISLANRKDNDFLHSIVVVLIQRDQENLEQEQMMHILLIFATISMSGEIISCPIPLSVKASKTLVPIQVLFSFKLND